jgi:hypothetical protein
LCQGDIISIDQRDCPVTSVVFQGFMEWLRSLWPW